MEPNHDEPKKPVNLENMPIFSAPPRTRPITWVRRIVVWCITIAVLSWAGIASYRVLAHRFVPPEPPSADAAPQSTLPASTGEYRHEDARSLFVAGRSLLRAGETSGIGTLEDVVRHYPDAPQARLALLAIAATHRYTAHEPYKAMKVYEDFVRRYPDDLQLPRAIRALRDLAEETGAPDPTQRLLRGALTQLEDKPEATARVTALLENY